MVICLFISSIHDVSYVPLRGSKNWHKVNFVTSCFHAALPRVTWTSLPDSILARIYCASLPVTKPLQTKHPHHRPNSKVKRAIQMMREAREERQEKQLKFKLVCKAWLQGAGDISSSIAMPFGVTSFQIEVCLHSSRISSATTLNTAVGLVIIPTGLYRAQSLLFKLPYRDEPIGICQMCDQNLHHKHKLWPHFTDTSPCYKILSDMSCVPSIHSLSAVYSPQLIMSWQA